MDSFSTLLLKLEEWQHRQNVARIKAKQAQKLADRKASPWNIPQDKGYKWNEYNTDVSAH